MNYIELNEKHKFWMQGHSKENIEFEFEDPEMFDFFCGKIEEIHPYNPFKEDEKHENFNRCVYSLNTLIREYNNKKTRKERFLSKLESYFEAVDDDFKKELWVSRDDFVNKINQRENILIKGVGGIGKSYSLFKLEELLEKEGIKHLCVYGKKLKKINDINFSELNKIGEKEEFVLIIDALNETYDKDDPSVLEKLNKFVGFENARLILSYRTNHLDKDTEQKYINLSNYQYDFLGISYESAVEKIIEQHEIDLFQYQSILESNSPLEIKMLLSILSKDKNILEKKHNANLAPIAYVMEEYVKGKINKKAWKSTKSIAAYMFENNVTSISNSVLNKILGGYKEKFVSQMKEFDFIREFDYNGESFYFFGIERLSEFLIARTLYQKIEKTMTIQEVINIIEPKIKALTSIKEAMVLVLFDKCNKDLKKLIKILDKTDLFKKITIELLNMVNFKKIDINKFKNHIKLNNKAKLLVSSGGFIDKPFNCTNYLNELFFNDPSELIKTSTEHLSGDRFLRRIILRLKNILYSINMVDKHDKRITEFLYFALWCSSAANKTIRFFSKKIIFDIVDLNNDFIEILIESYAKIGDEYIKESIIEVLCSLKKSSKEKTELFLQNILNDPDEINSRSVVRICEFLGKPNHYIRLQKINLFKLNKKIKLSQEVKTFLTRVDLIQKDFLSFKLFHNDDSLHFLLTPKTEVSKWSKRVSKEYACLQNRNYLSSRVEDLLHELYPMQSYGLKNQEENFINSFISVFLDVLAKYEVDIENDYRIKTQDQKTTNSYMYKYLDIASNQFIGSLMCNYFSEDFVCFDDVDYIGYRPYNPFDYQDSENLNLCIFRKKRPVNPVGIEQ